jgi:hypothetical protein
MAILFLGVYSTASKSNHTFSWCNCRCSTGRSLSHVVSYGMGLSDGVVVVVVLKYYLPPELRQEHTFNAVDGWRE